MKADAHARYLASAIGVACVAEPLAAAISSQEGTDTEIMMDQKRKSSDTQNPKAPPSKYEETEGATNATEAPAMPPAMKKGEKVRSGTRED